MKNTLITIKVLVLLLLIVSCEKAILEDQKTTSVTSATSTGMQVTERDGETAIDLGDPTAYGINPATAQSCSGAKFKVHCVQHDCQSLKSDPVDYWQVSILYYYINPTDQHLYTGQSIITSSGIGTGTWVSLNYPILKTSVIAPALTSGHQLHGHSYDTYPNAASTNIYVVFEADPSDNLITLHKIENHYNYPTKCSYYDVNNYNPFVTSKTLTIGNNCTNSTSSPNSQAYTPINLPYPCSIGSGGH